MFKLVGGIKMSFKAQLTTRAPPTRRHHRYGGMPAFPAANSLASCRQEPNGGWEIRPVIFSVAIMTGKNTATPDLPGQGCMRGRTMGDDGCSGSRLRRQANE